MTEIACFPGACVRRDLQARCDGLERDKTALLAQRDELLAACEALLGWAESVRQRVGVRMGDANTGAREQARAAIAKATHPPHR
jgi:hypothetical protein